MVLPSFRLAGERVVDPPTGGNDRVSRYTSDNTLMQGAEWTHPDIASLVDPLYCRQ